LITKSADVVVDEILEQVDYQVGEEGDNNQVNTGTVHTFMSAFLSGYKPTKWAVPLYEVCAALRRLVPKNTDVRETADVRKSRRLSF
jgi:hypothetical protein